MDDGDMRKKLIAFFFGLGEGGQDERKEVKIKALSWIC
jgi:hypothetical protein